jgi:hypothetical protein
MSSLALMFAGACTSANANACAFAHTRLPNACHVPVRVLVWQQLHRLGSESAAAEQRSRQQLQGAEDRASHALARVTELEHMRNELQESATVRIARMCGCVECL